MQKRVASFTDAWIETVIPLTMLAAKEVASFTDAWIETKDHDLADDCLKSHLLQMRGLKLTTKPTLRVNNVASFTDAWIETVAWNEFFRMLQVASFTDAWIETFGRGYKQQYQTSHLLQMRGLKLWKIL